MATQRVTALDRRLRHACADRGLVPHLGTVTLLAMGVAVMVGTGIFVLTGEAAAEYAGPAVGLSFGLAGLAALFTALSFAELAATVDTSGGTYSYIYVVMGPFVAWLIGWNLLLEYVMGAAMIAVGWSGYFANMLGSLGLDVPSAVQGGPFDQPAGVLNLPALVLIALLAALLMRGVSESTRVNNVLTVVKVAALVVFVVAGAFFVSSANYSPFIPPADGFGEFGATGVIRAAGVVFIAFLGFDTVASAAREARDPARTVPIAVIGSLLLATALYVAVATIMVGLEDYANLDVPDPLSTALQPHRELDWVRTVVNVSAALGLAAGVLSLIFGQSRIIMRMADDGFVPSAVSRVNPTSHTPNRAIAVTAGLCMLVAALVPLNVLAQLISAGTLLAFALISWAVIDLRRKRPDLPRPFRIPGGPIAPIVGIVTSLGVFFLLPPATFPRLILWMAAGVAIYVFYSRARAAKVIEDLIEAEEDPERA